MTKIEALRRSVRLWRWLSSKKGRRKFEWFNKYYPNEIVPDAGCYLCHLYDTDPNYHCENCPLFIELPCKGVYLEKQTPFEMWFRYSDLYSARLIYNALRRALRKAEKELRSI